MVIFVRFLAHCFPMTIFIVYYQDKIKIKMQHSYFILTSILLLNISDRPGSIFYFNIPTSQLSLHWWNISLRSSIPWVIIFKSLSSALLINFLNQSHLQWGPRTKRRQTEKCVKRKVFYIIYDASNTTYIGRGNFQFYWLKCDKWFMDEVQTFVKKTQFIPPRAHALTEFRSPCVAHLLAF